MRNTFRDSELQADLDRDGFAVVDLLGPDEVASLRASYDELGKAPGDPSLACHSSFHSYDRDYKVAVNDVIRAVIDPHLAATFDRQRALPCNFIVKWPAGTSGFGLHQDLSLVDEREHRSVEVWIALDETHQQNGQLFMVPGSHRWLPTNIRGINGFDFAFAEVTKRIIARHAVPVPVRPGQAVVFNHATLHCSFPNRTDTPRLVAITDLIPEEAQHLHYFGAPDGGIDVYEIGDEFWTDNTPFTLWKPPPTSALVDHLDRTPVQVDDAMLDGFVAAGLAAEVDEGPRGAINAAGTWCHRCGSREVEGYAPDRWIGNVTLLCEPCRQLELQRGASEDQIAPTPA